MQTRIIFNGHEYQSIEEMPDDIRASYQRAMSIVLADNDKSGIPDVLEGKGPANVNVTTTVVSKIVVNGKEYSSVGDMNDEIRHMLDSRLPTDKAVIQVKISPGKLVLVLLVVLIAVAVLILWK